MSREVWAAEMRQRLSKMGAERIIASLSTRGGPVEREGMSVGISVIRASAQMLEKVKYLKELGYEVRVRYVTGTRHVTRAPKRHQ